MRYYDYKVEFTHSFDCLKTLQSCGIVCAATYQHAAEELTKFFENISSMTINEWVEDTPVLEISPKVLDSLLEDDYYAEPISKDTK